MTKLRAERVIKIGTGERSQTLDREIKLEERLGALGAEPTWKLARRILEHNEKGRLKETLYAIGIQLARDMTDETAANRLRELADEQETVIGGIKAVLTELTDLVDEMRTAAFLRELEVASEEAKKSPSVLEDLEAIRLFR